MKVDDAMIDKLADLAKLEFEGQERKNIKSDLEKIVSFCEQLNGMDTTNVEPLMFVSDDKNVLRPDEVSHEITKDEALMNAPKKDSDYYRVPKFLEK